MWNSSDESGADSDDDFDRPKARSRVGILQGIFQDFEVTRSRQKPTARKDESKLQDSCHEEAGQKSSEHSHDQRIACLERENKELRLALLKTSIRQSSMLETVSEDTLSTPFQTQSDRTPYTESAFVVHHCSTASAPAAITLSSGEEDDDEVPGVSNARRSSTSKLFNMDWRCIPSIKRISNNLSFSSGGDEDELGADRCSRPLAEAGGIDNDVKLHTRGNSTKSEEDSGWKAFNQFLSELPKAARDIIRQQLDRYQAEIKYLQSVIAAYEDMYLNSSFHLLGPVTRISKPDARTSSALLAAQRRASHTGCFIDSVPMVNHRVGARPLSRQGSPSQKLRSAEPSTSPLRSFSREASLHGLNSKNGKVPREKAPLVGKESDSDDFELQRRREAPMIEMAQASTHESCPVS